MDVEAIYAQNMKPGASADERGFETDITALDIPLPRGEPARTTHERYDVTREKGERDTTDTQP
jgi:hypothetical protein